jgi:selenocysteine lyase/cysteine desulfurase
VLRLMAPRPQHRYADARQAAAALAAGRAEGVTLAGRQEALDAVARALGRARQGVAVVGRPRGPTNPYSYSREL